MLEVRDLRIHFQTDDGTVRAVDGVSFSLERGRTLGIVGESGSGKSVTSMGIMGLHHGTKAEITGQILLDGENLVEATPARVRELRGSKMAMIFQDPLSSLHPYYTIGAQIIEAYRIHNDVSKQAARCQAGMLRILAKLDHLIPIDQFEFVRERLCQPPVDPQCEIHPATMACLTRIARTNSCRRSHSASSTCRPRAVSR